MYSEIFELHASLLKALAHPRRLEIIHLLRDQELPVTDIYTMLDLPQANISQHLTILREAGVVQARKIGKNILYSNASPRIIKACDLLREVLIDQHKATKADNALFLHMKELVPLTQDPVCRMRVSPKTAGFHTRYQNADYYFCASGCFTQFQKTPEQYAIS